MPKTSKKTKVSKGTGLKRKFDLSNRRVQFFVTIAIVALLGGGWFTYKSFAAVAPLASYSPTALKLNGGAHLVTDAGNQVVRLPKDVQGSISLLGSQHLPVPANTQIRTCVEARSDHNAQVYFGQFFVTASDSIIRGGPPAPNASISSSYTTVCTPFQSSGANTYMNFELINGGYDTSVYPEKFIVDGPIFIKSLKIEKSIADNPACTGKNCPTDIK